MISMKTHGCCCRYLTNMSSTLKKSITITLLGFYTLKQIMEIYVQKPISRKQDVFKLLLGILKNYLIRTQNFHLTQFFKLNRQTHLISDVANYFKLRAVKMKMTSQSTSDFNMETAECILVLRIAFLKFQTKCSSLLRMTSLMKQLEKQLSC